ncbi:MAG: TetR/AcrR family transcriptional regulator [Pseudomonadota bacterium]
MVAVEPGRRLRKKDATYNAVVDVALRLFERDGFDGVTMERIAAEADVAKATLYRYFPVKEAILAAFVRRETARRRPDIEALIAAEPDTRRRLVVLYRCMAEWFAANRTYLSRYITYRLASPGGYVPREEERSGFHHHLALVLAAGQRDGDVRADRPVNELAGALGCLHLAAILRWLAEPESDLVATVEPMVSLFLEGAGRDGGRP